MVHTWTSSRKQVAHNISLGSRSEQLYHKLTNIFKYFEQMQCAVKYLFQFLSLKNNSEIEYSEINSEKQYLSSKTLISNTY